MTSFPAAIRIFDANANRAAEALRVLEDYVRFALEDAVLAKTAKQLRHDLQAAIASVDAVDRHACRETAGDVGTSVTTEAEGVRTDAHSVAMAACKRLQQALRSMEEYAKVIGGEREENGESASTANLPKTLEQLRYQSYSLERAIDLLDYHCRTLADAKLCVLIDCRESSAAFESLAGQILAAGAPMMQLRDKRASDRTLLDRGKRLRDLAAGHGGLFVMNDRVDLALAAGAHGVHVGQDELPVREVRRIVGNKLLVGVSTHCPSDLEAAVGDGASYIGAGPMFASTTKSFPSLAGLDYARYVAANSAIPAFAIGGVTVENAREVIAAGISRLAVRAAVVDAAQPAEAVRQLLKLCAVLTAC